MAPRKLTGKRARVGASSSRTVERVAFDRLRFTSVENSGWFEKLHANKLIVEKSIHPRIDMEVPIRAEFDKLGWGPLLDIRGAYYPELVWQFYANIEDKDKTGMASIRTFVKGVRIEVSSELVANVLGVPNDGPPVEYNQFDAFTSDPQFNFHDARTRLFYRRVPTGSRYSILPTSIPLIDRLICYFLSSNIIPRKAGNNELRNLDVYIIDKMLRGLGDIPALPVASIIISHMRSVAHTSPEKNAKPHAPFAITISKILQAVGVDFTGETSLFPSPTHMLNPQAMTGMYFISRGGTWYRNPASRNLTSHIRDPPVPPPTIGEQGREERVQEEEELDRAVEPISDRPGSSGASRDRRRSTRRVISSMYDCLDTVNGRLARLEHFAATSVYDPDIQAPPFDRSALDDFDDSDDVSDDEE